jgi:hypothetical protein
MLNLLVKPLQNPLTTPYVTRNHLDTCNILNCDHCYNESVHRLSILVVVGIVIFIGQFLNQPNMTNKKNHIIQKTVTIRVDVIKYEILHRGSSSKCIIMTGVQLKILIIQSSKNNCTSMNYDNNKTTYSFNDKDNE